jgi:DNA polymerase III alpha subunit
MLAAQLTRELALIDELDYCGYFLTMWGIVRFCKEKGILCQGRGSAANSAVCYCLGITAVDPVRTTSFSSASSRGSGRSRPISISISCTSSARR